MANVANAILIKFAKGWTGVGDVEDIGPPAGSGHPYGRRVEGILTTQATEQVEAQTLGVQALISVPAETVTVGVEPRGGDEPFAHYLPGDRLTVTDSTGLAQTSRRVWAIAFAIDVNGMVSYTPELNAPKLDPLEKQQRDTESLGAVVYADTDRAESKPPEPTIVEQIFGSDTGVQSDAPPFDPFA